MDTSTIEAMHDHYVRQGVAALDSFRPDWRKLVNVDAINIANGHDCVLGQVFAADWEAANEAHDVAMAAWRRGGRVGFMPPYPASTPYVHGRNMLFSTTGGSVSAWWAADPATGGSVSAWWAADHGFLADVAVSASAWSEDPEVTTQRLTESGLNEAWKRALA